MSAFSLRWAIGTLSLALLAAQPAAAAGHAPYKHAAVFGTLFSWAYAFVTDAPFTKCADKGLKLRLEYGADNSTSYDDGLKTMSVGVSKYECALKDSGSWGLSYTPMLNLTHWSADAGTTYNRSSDDLAIVPMLRWTPKWESLPVKLDFEMGIGAAFMTNPGVGNRQKSTHFQFSDHFGIGVSDPNSGWRVGFAFRHLSNLDLERPNNGANFFGASLEIPLQ